MRAMNTVARIAAEILVFIAVLITMLFDHEEA
jgi:hypothetical protein